MEYAWTLKVTKNDGSDQYTHLVDQGLFMKYALLHSQKSFQVSWWWRWVANREGGEMCPFLIIMIILLYIHRGFHFHK